MMVFAPGISCMHVVGYRQGDGNWPWPVQLARLLCGSKVEYTTTTDAAGVALSGMAVCKTCNRATHGQAVSDVEYMRLAWGPP